jgi:hypothetical protein
MATERRQRRLHGELQNAMREYLASKDGGPASISEVKAALEPKRLT